MPLGNDAFDRLAHALSETDFDAVERDGLRAEWTTDGTEVTVRDLQEGTEVVYNADDLVIATSDRELNDAREP
ncbi:hypothetical protein ACFQE8_21165 [Salinirubellus sp. GCM10025818]|uniref:hypothetical protein n=1 Tax=Salinirubellus TaxID=2162630 RepID=UPI0030D10338